MANLKLLASALGKRVGMLPDGDTSALPANEWDFLENPTQQGGGVFSSLIDKVKEIGAGGYELLLIIGIIGLAFSIIMTVISMLFTSSAQKKEEKKSHAVTICICGIVLFSVFSIIGFFKSIGGGL